MDILKIDAVNTGGNEIITLIYLVDGSMLAIGDGVVWRHKPEHVDSMLKHYNGSFEDADEKEYRENIRIWEEETQSFDIPDVWNHSIGFRSNNNV